jgi:hypothetical protein
VSSFDEIGTVSSLGFTDARGQFPDNSLITRNPEAKLLGVKLTGNGLCFLVHPDRAGTNVSVQTTERHLGCKQRLRNAVNDHIALESAAS